MLRKLTQTRRRLVTERGRVILGPEEGAASEMLVRRVTLSIPETPAIAVAIGPYEALGTDLHGLDDVGTTPRDIAHGRPHHWCPLDGGRDYLFEILAPQHISVMAFEGQAKIGMIVEYLEG